MFLLIVISAGLSRFKLRRIEGDSLCYVVLVLNDLAPDRVDSRTGKWGQTRKFRDRTEVAVRQRFNLACDARTCGCNPIIDVTS